MNRILAKNEVCPFETKGRRATDRLLSVLREHHDYSIPAPIAPPPPVVESPKVELVTDEWVARQLAIPRRRGIWFSVLDVGEPVKPRPTIGDIQRACSLHYGVSITDIVSARRTQKVVRPRQVAVYLARRLTTHSLPQISRRFGKRDHTTAMWAAQKITRLLGEGDAKLNADVATLIEALGGDVE